MLSPAEVLHSSKNSILLLSSSHATSTGLRDLLSQLVSILTISCLCSELLYIGSSWSSNLCLYMWRGPPEYIAFEVILTSLAVSRMSSSSNFDSFPDGW